MKEAQQGAARAAFLLFNLSGCSSPPLPGLERDGGALQTLRAPSCKERRQRVTAPGGRAGGGPSVPLNKQVSRSSPGIDFPRLSAKDISYCKVMSMRCPGDVCPCPCLLQPGLAGCGLCHGEAAGRCQEFGGQVKRFALTLCSATLEDAAAPELGAAGGAGMAARVLGLTAKGLITARGGKRHRVGQMESQGGWGAPGGAGACPKRSGSC